MCVIELPAFRGALATDMQRKYLQDQNNVILALINTKEGIDKQPVKGLVQRCSSRTIGVLTHFDELKKEEQRGWFKILESRSAAFELGYVAVNFGCDAHMQEYEFWLRFPHSLQRSLGAENLVKRVQRASGNFFKNDFSQFCQDCVMELHRYRLKYSRIPPVGTTNSSAESIISHLLQQFTLECGYYVNTKSELWDMIYGIFDIFKRNLWKSKPLFDFIDFPDDDDGGIEQNVRISLDQILSVIRKAESMSSTDTSVVERARRLFKEELVPRLVSPAQVCVTDVRAVLETLFKGLFTRHFTIFSHLSSLAEASMEQLLAERTAKIQQRITDLLARDRLTSVTETLIKKRARESAWVLEQHFAQDNQAIDFSRRGKVVQVVSQTKAYYELLVERFQANVMVILESMLIPGLDVQLKSVIETDLRKKNLDQMEFVSANRELSTERDQLIENIRTYREILNICNKTFPNNPYWKNVDLNELNTDIDFSSTALEDTPIFVSPDFEEPMINRDNAISGERLFATEGGNKNTGATSEKGVPRISKQKSLDILNTKWEHLDEEIEAFSEFVDMLPASAENRTKSSKDVFQELITWTKEKMSSLEAERSELETKAKKYVEKEEIKKLERVRFTETNQKIAELRREIDPVSNKTVSRGQPNDDSMKDNAVAMKSVHAKETSVPAEKVLVEKQSDTKEFSGELMDSEFDPKHYQNSSKEQVLYRYGKGGVTAMSCESKLSSQLMFQSIATSISSKSERSDDETGRKTEMLKDIKPISTSTENPGKSSDYSIASPKDENMPPITYDLVIPAIGLYRGERRIEARSKSVSWKPDFSENVHSPKQKKKKKMRTHSLRSMSLKKYLPSKPENSLPVKTRRTKSLRAMSLKNFPHFHHAKSKSEAANQFTSTEKKTVANSSDEAIKNAKKVNVRITGKQLSDLGCFEKQPQSLPRSKSRGEMFQGGSIKEEEEEEVESKDSNLGLLQSANSDLLLTNDKNQPSFRNSITHSFSNLSRSVKPSQELGVNWRQNDSSGSRINHEIVSTHDVKKIIINQYTSSSESHSQMTHKSEEKQIRAIDFEPPGVVMRPEFSRLKARRLRAMKNGGNNYYKYRLKLLKEREEKQKHMFSGESKDHDKNGDGTNLIMNKVESFNRDTADSSEHSRNKSRSNDIWWGENKTHNQVEEEQRKDSIKTTTRNIHDDVKQRGESAKRRLSHDSPAADVNQDNQTYNSNKLMFTAKV